MCIRDRFITTYGSKAETVLGEILLYIFMEQELDAPKILSKVEIDETNRNAVSRSDGVHLLSINKSGQQFHQLVFGASDIVGEMCIRDRYWQMSRLEILILRQVMK